MTAQEIFTTSRFNRPESERLADALADAPAYVLSCFRAMVSVGCYSVDEMVERIAALRMMAK